MIFHACVQVFDQNDVIFERLEVGGCGIVKIEFGVDTIYDLRYSSEAER